MPAQHKCLLSLT